MLPAALRPIQSEPLCSLKSIKIVEMRYLSSCQLSPSFHYSGNGYELYAPHILILYTLRLFRQIEQTDKRLFTLLRSTHIP
jgi:hypothetical protein